MTFSSRRRRQRSIRRYWRNCRWCSGWCRRWSQWSAWRKGWIGWVGWSRALTFCSYRNYWHVSPVCLLHHIYLHLHKSSTVPVLLTFSITAEQRSAVGLKFWTQHFNKCIEINSSAIGTCQNDRGLCEVNCWFVGLSKYSVWTAL